MNRNRQVMTAIFFFLGKVLCAYVGTFKLTFGRGAAFEDLAGILVEMSNRPLGMRARSWGETWGLWL